MLDDIELDFGSPILALNEPFNPSFFDFLSIIFMIPPLPSASYLAEGDVITSTFSMASAGNSFMNDELIPTNLDGFPFLSNGDYC